MQRLLLLLHFVMCMPVIVIGLLLLIGPELLVQHRFNCIDDVLVAFTGLFNILGLAWIVLFKSYLSKTFFVPTNDIKFLRLANETEQYLSGLHESATSPIGLLGVCAAVSVTSTMLWLFWYVIVHWSFPAVVRHGLTETLHVLLLAVITHVLVDRPSPQRIHYFFLKVVCFNATWRLIDSVQGLLLDRSARGHLRQQLKALLVLALAACEPTIIAYFFSNYMDSEIQLTAWLTFPVILFRGIGAGIFAEYLIRIGAKNTTRLFRYAEDDVALFAMVNYS